LHAGVKRCWTRREPYPPSRPSCTHIIRPGAVEAERETSSPTLFSRVEKKNSKAKACTSSSTAISTCEGRTPVPSLPASRSADFNSGQQVGHFKHDELLGYSRPRHRCPNMDLPERSRRLSNTAHAAKIPSSGALGCALHRTKDSQLQLRRSRRANHDSRLSGGASHQQVPGRWNQQHL